MKQILADALTMLRRHPAILQVGEENELEDGTFVVEFDVEVPLPSRTRAARISCTGVRDTEPCLLVFRKGWPLRAPLVLLRQDFPLNLPHINPHKSGDYVSPCLFEGSLDEVLHRFGLEGIIDQLCEWLGKAAAGQLIDLEHGWEPTRRDSCPSTVIFSAEDAIAKTAMDGSVLITEARYISQGEGILAVLNGGLEHKNQQFSQSVKQDENQKWGIGSTQVFISRGVDQLNKQPLEVSTYQPESVCDLDTFLDQLTRLGVDAAALRTSLDEYYQLSVLKSHDQNPKNWSYGLFAIVIVLVHRPAQLVGAPGRKIEVLPYVVHYCINTENLFEPQVTVHSAFHAHALSANLLAVASGLSNIKMPAHMVMLGCGSLGSKIAMHLGKSGIGNFAFVDKEEMSPHNAARHALIPPLELISPPNKAELMRTAFISLRHEGTTAHDSDAVEIISSDEAFNNVVNKETTLILDTTASLQLLAAETLSTQLDNSQARLVRSLMYGQGRSVVLMLEGADRTSRVDDLTATLFERCRHDEKLRRAISGEGTDPTRLFVGDNCRSLTMPMPDSIVSRAASMVSNQLEQWFSAGIPPEGVLCIGTEDDSGIGVTWLAERLGLTTALSAGNSGWSVRVLEPIHQALANDARKWNPVETGGALIGHVSTQTRTIIISGLVEAPPDSVRQRDKFILGIEGLAMQLRQANIDSVGHLQFVGTWHSHPMGGSHSYLDWDTLKRIAADAEGWPAVSLVWTPEGLIAAVEQL